MLVLQCTLCRQVHFTLTLLRDYLFMFLLIQLLLTELNCVDIVLLTDCVFSLDLVPALVDTIRGMCGPKTEVYCCHEIRDLVGYVG
jgi:hypothetical protein